MEYGQISQSLALEIWQSTIVLNKAGTPASLGLFTLSSMEVWLYRMADVWIIIQKITFKDGSNERFVSSVHKTCEPAQKFINEMKDHTPSERLRRVRRNRFGKDIFKTEYKLENWHVGP
jgi:hypothetical protein